MKELLTSACDTVAMTTIYIYYKCMIYWIYHFLYSTFVFVHILIYFTFLPNFSVSFSFLLNQIFRFLLLMFSLLYPHHLFDLSFVFFAGCYLQFLLFLSLCCSISNSNVTTVVFSHLPSNCNVSHVLVPIRLNAPALCAEPQKQTQNSSCHSENVWTSVWK